MSPPVGWRAIALLLVVALGPRLYHLGDENLWHDEVYQVAVASQSPAEIVSNYHAGCAPGECDQAPLSPLVTHYFLSEGHDEGLARLPSALFGVAGVGALLAVGARMLPGRVALLGAFFLALSPIHVWYSQEVRWYTLWALLTTLSYAALGHAIVTGGLRAWVTYAALGVLGGYTFVLHFLVIACQAITVLMVPGRARNVLAFAAATTAVLLACFPVVLVTLGDVGLETGTPRPTSAAVAPYTFFVHAVGYSVGPTLAELHALPPASRVLAEYPSVLLYAAVFAPLTIAGAWQAARDRMLRAILLPWVFGLPLLVLAVVLASNVTYHARYSFASVPSFLLLVALGAWVRGRPAVSTGAVVAVLACFAISLGNYYWNPRYDKERVRAALAHVRANDGSGAPALIVGQISLVAAYYGRRLGVATTDACEPDGSTVWLLVGRDWKNAGPTCLDHLSSRYSVADRHRLPGVDLWRLALHEPR